MTVEVLIALAMFAFVSSITPGPNNIMLMNSGANYGFRRTVPHLFGVGLGFTFMIMLVGFGVIGLFDAYPISYQILRVLSIAYLLYLAFKIATSTTGVESKQEASQPMSFIEAALFQWVNPKAWSMALSAISLYAPEKSLLMILAVAVVFGLVNFPCIISWIVLGKEMKRLLINKRRLLVFNWAMAALLIFSLLPALMAMDNIF